MPPSNSKSTFWTERQEGTYELTGGYGLLFTCLANLGWPTWKISATVWYPKVTLYLSPPPPPHQKLSHERGVRAGGKAQFSIHVLVVEFPLTQTSTEPSRKPYKTRKKMANVFVFSICDVQAARAWLSGWSCPLWWQNWTLFWKHGHLPKYFELRSDTR